jgi:hypothetical protein
VPYQQNKREKDPFSHRIVSEKGFSGSGSLKQDDPLSVVAMKSAIFLREIVNHQLEDNQFFTF